MAMLKHAQCVYAEGVRRACVRRVGVPGFSRVRCISDTATRPRALRRSRKEQQRNARENSNGRSGQATATGHACTLQEQQEEEEVVAEVVGE